MTEPPVRISICIVTGRRLPLLEACLASIRDQVDAPGHEVLVCSDGDLDVVDTVHRRLPDARVCLVESALPGAARNLLVDQARGELLLFLDDDATLEHDALARLDRLADAHPEAGVFGGPNDTPPGSTRFQFVQGAVLASIVGSGPVRRRYGAHPPGLADERFFILCNLAVRRRVMLPFAHDLVCAEENAVLSDMSRDGIPMVYDPELIAYHQRRPTLRGFAQQMFKYGRGRGQLSRRDPRTLRPAYLVPSALILCALLAPLAAALVHPLFLAPLALYAAAVAAAALWIARTVRRPADALLAGVLLVVLHVMYGTGLVRGLVEPPREGPGPEVLQWSEPARPRATVDG
jgi:glycosyltransferase involved in cell wall biosynthesis